MPVKEDGTFAAAIGLEVTGSAEFIPDANILIEKFQDIFSSNLGQEPPSQSPSDRRHDRYCQVA
jgi:hypothetical protein